MTNECFLFDIDGTIADISHRQHFLDERPKNWDAFHAATSDDVPLRHMRIVLRALVNHLGPRHVLYVTGRVEKTRAATVEWLRWYNFPQLRLLMRPDGDYRDDTILKREMLDQLRAEGFVPLMVFEDRSRVVNMWREVGVPCAQVAPGDF